MGVILLLQIEVNLNPLIEYFRIGFKNFGSVWENIIEKDVHDFAATLPVPLQLLLRNCFLKPHLTLPSVSRQIISQAGTQNFTGFSKAAYNLFRHLNR